MFEEEKKLDRALQNLAFRKYKARLGGAGSVLKEIQHSTDAELFDETTKSFAECSCPRHKRYYRVKPPLKIKVGRKRWGSPL